MQIEAGSAKGSTGSQPPVEAVVIPVHSIRHRTTSESFYIKMGETKSRWQEETTKAFRRHALICSLHSNNPKWLLICTNNGVLTDLKVGKINPNNPALEGLSSYCGNCSAMVSGESNDEVIEKTQCFSVTGNEGSSLLSSGENLKY